jgi:flavin reductase (DIM6/NTAB) family NADH-FMN oxidoreductase RutF
MQELELCAAPALRRERLRLFKYNLTEETLVKLTVASAPERVAKTRDNLTDSLRLALRRVASTVYVVAVKSEESFFAATATAVTSVSFNPPTVLVCLNRSSAIGAAIEQCDVFSLSVLKADQASQSQACAGGTSHDERKTHFTPYEGEYDALKLRDAQAALICRKTAAVHAGTHVIVLGEIVDALHDEDINPLVYLDGKYGAFSASKI